MLIHRRNFLIGALSALAAPAIVRAENIMPVRNVPIATSYAGKSFRLRRWDGAERDFNLDEGAQIDLWNILPSYEEISPGITWDKQQLHIVTLYDQMGNGNHAQGCVTFINGRAAPRSTR